MKERVKQAKFACYVECGFSISDNVIKVWRVYPFVQEALAPLMSFFCAHLPLHMTMIKTHLCVAFQDHATATYSIVMYNLRDRSK